MTETRRAAIYTRLSLDPQGTRLAVTRQEEDARALAAGRGWEVAAVFEDNDLSAFSGKPRPAFEQLLDAVAAGTVDAVVSWDPDRIYRRGKDLIRFVDAVQAAGIPVATVTAGDIDLTTAAGRMQARIIGAVSEHESEHKAERQRRAARQKAEAGLPSGSHRPYGYTDHRRTAIDPAEAEVIREAARRILAGDTLRGVCRDLNDRGIRGATGRQWSPNVLKNILAGAGISGRREVRQEAGGKLRAIGRITGPGVTWPPIISVEDSDALRALLGSPTRRTSIGRPAGYLLTGGVAVCGVCGAPLAGRVRQTPSPTPVLECMKSPGRAGCNGLKVVARPVEAIVTEAVLRAVDGGALAALLRSQADPAALAELARVEQRRTELAAQWAAEELSRAEWDAARKVLEGRERELRRRVEAGRRTAGLAGLDGPLRASWPSLGLVRQRAVIKALIEVVVIAPAAKEGRTFDPERITIRWRV